MAAEDYIEFDADPTEMPDEPYVWPRQPYVNRHTPIAGLPRHGMLWETWEDEKLLKLWDKGYAVNEISKLMGRTPVSIHSRLAKHGIDSDESMGLSKDRPTQVTPTTKAPVAKKGTYVNMQHLITLLQKGYTTVEVQFFRDSTKYTYKVPSEMAKGLAKGDQLVVPTHKENRLAVATVNEVHDEPQIDVNAPFEFKWAVQKVDTTAYDDQTKREAEAVEKIKKAERRQAQEQALQTLLGDADAQKEFLALIAAPAAKLEAQ